MEDKPLYEELMEVLHKRAKEENVYTNPHFLSDLLELINVYYKVESDTLDDWVQDMYETRYV